SDDSPALDASAVALKRLRQSPNQSMRIGGVAILPHDDALDVVAREVRIQLAQLLLRELIPTHAILAAQAPRQLFLLPAAEGPIDEQMTLALDQVLCARVAYQRRQRLDPLVKERP